MPIGRIGGEGERMTDEEMIKAMEICVSPGMPCDDCPRRNRHRSLYLGILARLRNRKGKGESKNES